MTTFAGEAAGAMVIIEGLTAGFAGSVEQVISRLYLNNNIYTRLTQQLRL